MTEHTPTPWRNDQKPDALIVCDAEGGSIADCAPPGPWMGHKTALANAAFIVRACNSHDALVEYVRSSASAGCATAKSLIEQIDGAQP